MAGINRNGIWIGVLAAALLSGCADFNPPEQVSGRWGISLENDLKQWPLRIIEDSNNVFTQRDNMFALVLAGGASIAMHKGNADDDIADNFDDHDTFQGFSDEAFNVIGHPGTHFAAAGLWYALSAESYDEINRSRAWTMMTALAINGIATTGLKAIRDNETPNGNSWAWPSGHTSSSFTAASVLDEFYGPGVGIPAYGVASVVAWRMMDTGDHWGSDVVFGATLGWVIGHSVAGRHRQLELAGFKIIPYAGGYEETSMGVGLYKRF